MFLDLEAPKCPTCSDTENQQRHWRPKQKNWNHKKIASGEFAKFAFSVACSLPVPEGLLKIARLA
jgi:hypothetical protein